jgi:hypothetical protein
MSLKDHLPLSALSFELSALFFFTDDGFVSVLEKVAAPFMTLVEGNGIASHKATHDLTKWRKTGSEQQMKMVWD